MKEMVAYTGKPLKRFEDEPLVTGKGYFVDDITFPDILYAAVLRSPHAHARIETIDASAARHLPGVEMVLTADDLAGRVLSIPFVPRQGGIYEEVQEHPVLAREKVCYAGQPVAVVAAQDRYQARDALDCIQIAYQPLQPVIDPHLAVNSDTPPIHESIGTNVAMRVRTGKGDVDAAFDRADHIVREHFELPRLSAMPLEGRGSVACYEPAEQLLTLWTSTQVPHRIKSLLAEVFGQPPKHIRVIAPDVGGGFGQKTELWPEDVAISYLAMTLTRPIKWIESRMENMLAYHGRGYTAEVEAAIRNDGAILGMRFRIMADMGAYLLTFSAVPPVNVTQRVVGPYAIPGMQVECLGVLTNKPPTGPYRGAGAPESAYFMERTIDLIAGTLNLDPAEVRCRNLIPPEAFPYTTATGITYDSGNFESALHKALTLAEYESWRQAQQSRDASDPLIGLGVATVVKASGGVERSRSSRARVAVQPTGQVHVFTEVSPHGQGTRTSFAQIAADIFGINPDRVDVLHGDTEMLPSGQGTYASRGLTVGGSAVYEALQAVRKQAIHLAAHLLGCASEEVMIGQGYLYHGSAPADRLPLAQLAAKAQDPEYLPPGMKPGLEFEVSYTLPDNPYAFAAHVAVVEVDRDTGEIRCLRYVAVQDSGGVINPIIVRGQIHGGVVQGMGQALSEGMVYSPDGQPLNASLMDYAAPRAGGVPRIIVDVLETPSPTNPLGIKGVGELPTVASPVVIANAVLDALATTEVVHLDLPLTPEKVWRVLHNASS